MSKQTLVGSATKNTHGGCSRAMPGDQVSTPAHTFLCEDECEDELRVLQRTGVRKKGSVVTAQSRGVGTEALAANQPPVWDNLMQCSIYMPKSKGSTQSHHHMSAATHAFIRDHNLWVSGEGNMLFISRAK